MPGKRFRAMTKAGGKGSAKRYHALRRAGMSKASAARITIKGRSKSGRKAMARKAARTRKKRS